MENKIFVKKIIDYYLQKGGQKVDIYETVDYNIFNNNSMDDFIIKNNFKKNYTNITNSTFKDINNRVLRKSIQNPKVTPWLDWIEQGIKTYEGRLNKGDWINIKANDIIIFYDSKGKEVKTRVIKMLYFKNFIEAYRELGMKLVPLRNISENDVENLYLQYFTRDDINRYGVVAVQIQVIK